MIYVNDEIDCLSYIIFENSGTEILTWLEMRLSFILLLTGQVIYIHKRNIVTL